MGYPFISRGTGPLDDIGQIKHHVTPTGTGSGSSWSDPCSLDTALANCSDTFQDLILLGAGFYNADRAGDGFVCDKNYVTIRGLGIGKSGPGLTNQHASGTSVLKVTGDLFSATNLQVRGTATATAFVLSGGFYCDMQSCVFVNGSTGTVTGTGVEITDQANAITFTRCLFSQSGIGLLFDDCFQCIIEHCLFTELATGIKLAGTDETQISVGRSVIEEASAIGFHLAGANISDIRFWDNQLLNNVDDIKDESGTFGTTLMYDLKPSQSIRYIWPGEDGVSGTTGSGPWVWGSPVTFIDSLDIPDPFFVVQFVVQDVDPAPVNTMSPYEVEISAGPNLATQVVAGSFQFIAADKKGASGAISVTRTIGQYFQPTLAATFRVKSGLTGVKNVVLSMEYYTL